MSFKVPRYQSSAKTVVCVCVCIESSQKVYEWPSWPTTEVGGRELDNLGHLDGHLSSQTQVVEEDFEICGNQNHLEFSFLLFKVCKQNFADYPNECN